MRILDDRYQRDVRRYNLAVRMIHYEVRTHAITVWTGLSKARVRSLCRSYFTEHVARRAVRHRGPAPRSAARLTRAPGLRNEAAAAAVLCRAMGIVGATAESGASRPLPSVARGERACAMYEAFCDMVPKPLLTLEHVLLLIRELDHGKSLQIGPCTACRADILIDRLSGARRVCTPCHLGERRPVDLPAEEVTHASARNARDSAPWCEPVQQSLF